MGGKKQSLDSLAEPPQGCLRVRPPWSCEQNTKTHPKYAQHGLPWPSKQAEQLYVQSKNCMLQSTMKGLEFPDVCPVLGLQQNLFMMKTVGPWKVFAMPMASLYRVRYKEILLYRAISYVFWCFSERVQISTTGSFVWEQCLNVRKALHP